MERPIRNASQQDSCKDASAVDMCLVYSFSAITNFNGSDLKYIESYQSIVTIENRRCAVEGVDISITRIIELNNRLNNSSNSADIIQVALFSSRCVLLSLKHALKAAADACRSDPVGPIQSALPRSYSRSANITQRHYSN